MLISFYFGIAGGDHTFTIWLSKYHLPTTEQILFFCIHLNVVSSDPVCSADKLVLH